MSTKTEQQPAAAVDSSGSVGSWTKCEDQHPEDMMEVIAKYDGVYGHRIVTFWRDGGGNAHYGHPNEADGKGSQPATHWKYLEA